MTAFWIMLALVVGATLGFVLFAAFQVSREEEEMASRAEALLLREGGSSRI